MEICLGDFKHHVEKPEISENGEAANKTGRYHDLLNRLQMTVEEGEPMPVKQILQARAKGQVEGGSPETATLWMMWRQAPVKAEETESQ